MSAAPPIRIVPSDKRWVEEFQDEARRIKRAMGNAAARIDHVGSTSIPGLEAKAIIDIQISTLNLHPLQPHITALASVGYTHIPLPAPPEDSRLSAANEVYPYFSKPERWPGTHHVHVCKAGSEEERNHIIFRDYLRDHADEAQAYVQLKHSLAAANSPDRADYRERYSLGKTAFVRRIVELALADGYRIGP